MRGVLCEGRKKLDDRWPRLAPSVTEIQDQGQVAIVDNNARDIDDLADALLGLLGKGEHFERTKRGRIMSTLEAFNAIG